MDLGLNDRMVIITGASGGIGRELARAFAAEGTRVLLTYHHARADADAVATEIGEAARSTRYVLGDPDSAPSVVAAALAWTGRIDVLVNNAVEFTGPVGGGFENVPDSDWTPVVRHNVEGVIALTRLVTPIMRKQRWGRIVHLSSSTVNEGMEGGEYYTAAKSALHGFSRSVAFSLGRDGDILSNVVLPGFTRTDRNKQWEMFPKAEEAYLPKVALGRLLDAAEVANAIVYLCSAANTGITGQAISVTGGA
jgi:3-oxoacyl-[acyl-carrier protein] reductase